ncbi:MAG: DUF4267 domain-containing protein [Candidatus Rokuibacteriota bacterium]
MIAGAAGLGILIVGVLYLLRPRTMAASFGLPVLPSRDATAWLRLKGIRDLATGVVAGVLIATASSGVLGGALAAFAIIPIGDALTILRANGERMAAFAIHGLTAAIMLTGSGLLLAAG